MGAPTSSIQSEFYLQHLENPKIYDILLNFNIMGYLRYVDDLLIIYNERKTDIEDHPYYFNNIAPKLNFSIEKDLTLLRDVNSFSIGKGSRHIRPRTYPLTPATPSNISTLQYATYKTD